MKVVVYPHSLDVGGSQLNAVELAAAVRDRGHEVLVFAATAGPLADHVETLGLPLHLAPPWRRRPSPTIMSTLTELARRERVDVLHPYEWPPCLEVFAGPHLRDGRAVVATVMSMGVSPMIPSSTPLVVGTEQIAASARGRRGPVHVLEPPVDTDANHPGIPGDDLRARFALDPARPTIVVVSRLAAELKREGIERAIDAVEQLDSAGSGPQLLVVGDGPDRARIDDRARAVNGRLGGPRVVLAGELLDPRPAYALADVVLGMGGSALRAMAFAKPLVVLGERGFSEVLEPHTWEQFLWSGFFGIGDGDRSATRLAGQVRSLLADPNRRAELGRFSRRLVEERFSLRRAAEVQEDVYRRTLAAPRPALRVLLSEASLAGAHVLASKVGRRLPVGRRAVDDCNGPEALARTAARAGAAPGPTATPDRS